jgi:hypothetical protein
MLYCITFQHCFLPTPIKRQFLNQNIKRKVFSFFVQGNSYIVLWYQRPCEMPRIWIGIEELSKAAMNQFYDILISKLLEI